MNTTSKNKIRTFIFCLIAFASTSHADESLIRAQVGDKLSEFQIANPEKGKYLLTYRGDSAVISERALGKRNHDFVTKMVSQMTSGPSAIMSRPSASCARDLTTVKYTDDQGKANTVTVCLFDRSADSIRVQDLLNVLFMGL
jgi:hypothetical protein